MNYFQAENLSKSYAEKLLFEQISFSIEQGQKVGLIARNGAGKSTLLNIMMKREIPDAGHCTFRNDIRVAYLEQNPVFDPTPTVLQTLLNDSNPTIQILRQYTQQLKQQEGNPAAAESEKWQAILTQMDELDAWNLEAKIKQILHELKIENLEQPMGELSGGQLKRVALAKILIKEAHFIILDEPTNHLDLQMIEWLEDYLARQKLTLLLVTHDRYFLDSVCTEILELDQGQMYRYRGNYAMFLEKKQERQSIMQAQTEKARNLLKKETEWMRRQPKARTTKSKARIDAYHQLREAATSSHTSQTGEINLYTARMGKKILELQSIHKQFDDKKIIRDFSYIFKRREKVGIIGMNGTGKTTLLNIITGKLNPDKGTITTGETVQFGYYTQEGMQVEDDKKVIDVIKDIAESIRVGKDKIFTAAQLLHYFNFPFHAQNDLVRKLSGGEKRRLYLLTVLMQNPNFLILDEPTNDLDIATLNILEEFLADFPGCLLIVSHDRYFMDNLADHVFVFEGNGHIRDFPGNYTEYRQKKAQEESAEKKQEKTENKNAPPSKPKDKEKTKLSYREMKEFEALELEIQQLEDEKSALLEKLNAGTAPAEELREMAENYALLEKKLEDKENRWLELSQWV